MRLEERKEERKEGVGKSERIRGEGNLYMGVEFLLGGWEDNRIMLGARMVKRDNKGVEEGESRVSFTA